MTGVGVAEALDAETVGDSSDHRVNPRTDSESNIVANVQWRNNRRPVILLVIPKILSYWQSAFQILPRGAYKITVVNHAETRSNEKKAAHLDSLMYFT